MSRRTIEVIVAMLGALALIAFIGRDLLVRHRFGVDSPQYRELTREPPRSDAGVPEYTASVVVRVPPSSTEKNVEGTLLTVVTVWLFGAGIYFGFVAYLFRNFPVLSFYGVIISALLWPVTLPTRIGMGLFRAVKRNPAMGWRVGVIAGALIVMAGIGVDLALRRPLPPAVAGYRHPATNPSEADIEGDAVSQDEYWAGHAWAMSHAVTSAGPCEGQTNAYRRGCLDYVKIVKAAKPPARP